MKSMYMAWQHASWLWRVCVALCNAMCVACGGLSASASVAAWHESAASKLWKNCICLKNVLGRLRDVLLTLGKCERKRGSCALLYLILANGAKARSAARNEGGGAG